VEVALVVLIVGLTSGLLTNNKSATSTATAITPISVRSGRWSRIADDELTHSWLFWLSAPSGDTHKLCSSRLFELEALGRDLIIQADLCHL